MGIIQAWLDAYPAEHRAHLKGRLKSRRPGQRAGAGLELLLHAMLRAMEWEVRVSAGTPDFIVTDQEGATQFAVEATSLEADRKAETKMKVSSDVDKILKEFDHDHRDHRVVCCINFMPNPNYCFPKNHFLEYLEERMKSYKGSGYEDFIFNEWTISVKMSLAVEHYGSSLCMEGGSTDAYSRTKEALSEKYEKYDGGGKPYIIAIALSDTFVGDDDFRGPLLNVELPALSLPTREHVNNFPPAYPNISGLWGFSRVRQVHGIESNLPVPLPRQCRYFPNPSAQFPLNNPFPDLSRYDPEGERIGQAMSIARLLGIPEDCSEV